MNLKDAKEGIEYIIKDIVTGDEELDSFLFSLGCYAGEPITVISQKKGGCIVSIKDSSHKIIKLLLKIIQPYLKPTIFVLNLQG